MYKRGSGEMVPCATILLSALAAQAGTPAQPPCQPTSSWLLEDTATTAVSYLQATVHLRHAQQGAPSNRSSGSNALSGIGGRRLTPRRPQPIVTPEARAVTFGSPSPGGDRARSARSSDGPAPRKVAAPPEGESAPQLLQSRSGVGVGSTTSAAFRCHRLLPLGSWALFAICCCVANFGFFYALGLYESPKAAWLAERAGLPPKAGAAVFGGCLLLLAVQCLAMGRCLQGRLEFVHIPKNAGTTIEMTGRSAGIAWGVSSIAFRFNRRMPDGFFCSSHHVPPRYIRGMSPYAGAELFCVTRHPYDRAVSEYSYLLSVPWTSRYARDYANGIYDRPVCSKEGLNHFVQTTLTLYQRGQKFIDNCHHLPQSEFIWDGSGTPLCTNIIRSDNLSQAFDVLMEKHGYPLKMPAERENDNGEVCPGLSTQSLAPETRQMLRSVYADDFRLLNYTAW
mmetsp:Transcript_90526/g.281827  ORF Transcript_90526/g.281827 Transcript_90526/m.281827 type:complete len:451 (+) Transcript_90526:107-1459(+)